MPELPVKAAANEPLLLELVKGLGGRVLGNVHKHGRLAHGQRDFAVIGAVEPLSEFNVEGALPA